jgi:predicted metal-binding membrane protein
MSVLTAAAPRRTAGVLRAGRRPETLAALVVVAAWAALLLRPDPAMGHMHDMEAAPPTMTSWLLMTTAMMGPATLAGVSHVARNSLRWRRGRAVIEYAVGYLAAWATTGALVLAVVSSVPDAPGRAALAVVLLGASAWQLTPVKRTCLREGHLSLPLPPRGRRAELAALRFGWRNGAACVGSCWCMMLTMAVAPAGHVPMTAGLTLAVTAERLTRRPRWATRLVAVALAAAGAAVTLG